MNRNEPESPPAPARYSITVDEAVLHFSEAGVPRSPRSIRRYCERGHLEATLADGVQGERYLIDRESIDRRIKELRQQQVVSRRDRKEPDASASNPPGPAKAGSGRAHSKHVQALEAEILDLRITNRAKDYALQQFKEERAALLKQVETKSHRIGELETRLVLQAGVPPDQLTAPREVTPEPSSEPPQEPASSESDLPGPSPTDQEPSEAPPEPRAPAES